MQGRRDAVGKNPRGRPPKHPAAVANPVPQPEQHPEQQPVQHPDPVQQPVQRPQQQRRQRPSTRQGREDARGIHPRGRPPKHSAEPEQQLGTVQQMSQCSMDPVPDTVHAVAATCCGQIAPAPPSSSTGSASAASAASAAPTQLPASVEDEQAKQAERDKLAAERVRVEAERAQLADKRVRLEAELAELADERKEAEHAKHAERDKLAAERARVEAERAQLADKRAQLQAELTRLQAHNPVENLLDKISEGECYQAHSVSEASSRASTRISSSSTRTSSTSSTSRCTRSGEERGWFLEKFFTAYEDDNESIEMSKLFKPGTDTKASAKIITSGTAMEMHVEIDRAAVQANPNLYKGKLDQMLLHPEQADKTQMVQSQCMIRAFREIKDNLISQGIDTDILGHAHAGTVLGESGFILSPMGELACRYGQPIPPTPRVLTSVLMTSVLTPCISPPCGMQVWPTHPHRRPVRPGHRDSIIRQGTFHHHADHTVQDSIAPDAPGHLGQDPARSEQCGGDRAAGD